MWVPAVQRIMRDYCKQVYISKLDNLEDTDQFQKTYNLPRLNNEEIKSLNRLYILVRRLNLYSKTSQQIKVQDHMASLVNYTKYL